MINKRTACAAPPGAGHSLGGFTISQVTADHYFSAEPAAPARTGEVEFSVAGRSFTARHRVRCLLRRPARPGNRGAAAQGPPAGRRTPGARCSTWAAGTGRSRACWPPTAPDATVYAIDVNSRARELAAANAATLRLATGCGCPRPDDVPADVVFDEIWSNPPIHVGKAELHEMLERWLPRLAPGRRGLAGDQPAPGR